MSQETNQKDFEGRVQELLAFAKEKEIFIGACQQIDKQGRIETTPLYRDLKQWVREAEAKTTSETTGTPSPDEFLPEKK